MQNDNKDMLKIYAVTLDVPKDTGGGGGEKLCWVSLVSKLNLLIFKGKAEHKTLLLKKMNNSIALHFVLEISGVINHKTTTSSNKKFTDSRV